ncbi:hypothetical protein Q1695_002131 [Nippostrongylus brasiliensis]|nr:hypothetical protein Q1695_002131 [Nippostrongylus brasiliensis]
MRFSVVTVSDSSAAGLRKDASGPTIVELIEKSTRLREPTISATVVIPDERAAIEAVLFQQCSNSDVVITTGGTGFAKRDVTPEATLNVIERRCSGLEVALHQRSLAATPMAALSRAVAGIRGSTLIVNFPGSVKAVKECWEVLEPVLNHATDLLNNTDDGTLHSSMATQAGDR